MANDLLTGIVAAALIFSALAFIAQLRRAYARGRMTRFAPPRGNARSGVIYAFTLGMDPRAKDGVRRHPYVLVAGAMFHAGIFASAATAIAVFALGSNLSDPFWKLAALAQAAGAAAALGLIARRSGSSPLRAISRGDDYVSNILVFATLVAGAGVTVLPELVPMFAAAVVLVLVYAPFGKIRHCVLFFPARLQYGRFFGRRSVLPPRARMAP